MKDLFLAVPAPTTNNNRTESSLFDQELRKRWKEATDKGICRYQLNILRNETMRGNYRYILQVLI